MAYVYKRRSKYDCCVTFVCCALCTAAPVLLALAALWLTGLAGPAANVTKEWSCVRRPWWVPPFRVYVCTAVVIYLLTGVSGFLLWRHGQGYNRHTRAPWAMFLLSLACSIGLPLLQYGYRLACLGLLVTTAGASVAVCFVLCAWHISAAVALLHTPQSLWLCLLTAAAYRLVLLNGCHLPANCDSNQTQQLDLFESTTVDPPSVLHNNTGPF